MDGHQIHHCMSINRPNSSINNNVGHERMTEYAHVEKEGKTFKEQEI